MPRIQNRLTARSGPSAGPVTPRAADVASPRSAGDLAAAFDAAPGAMLLLDDDRRCVAANRAACDLLGLASDRLLADGAIAPVQRALDDAISRCWAQAMSVGAGSGGCQLVSEDGTRVSVDFALSARITSGRHLLTLHDGAASTAALVTRLRRQLVEAQSVGGFGHWEWDIVADTVDWSDQLHRICGLEPDAVTTFGDVHDLIHPDDLADTAAALRDAREHGDGFAHAFRIVRPDGTIRAIESRGEVVRGDDGSPVRMFGTALDITDRRRAENDRRKFSTILDGSDDAISACSLDGLLVSWNRGAEKLYGYTAEEAIGKHVTMLLPAEERSAAYAAWKRSMVGDHVEPFESLRVTKDGRRLVVAVTLSPITDASGAIIGVAAVGRDMTEQRRTQVELAAAHAKAVEASRLKSEFMANMNHELRTPLNGVIGVSGLLLDTNLDEEQREYVDALRVSGAALMAVIDDILDFSKIEAGKLEIEAEPFELAPLIEDVCSMVAVGQPGRSVEVIASVPVEAPAVIWGDAKRVRQVLTNLTNNAVKFTQRGQVAVGVSVSARTADELVLRFEVVDTGIGIDPHVQASIFESFCQADGSTTRRFGGTGLGLTIAKQLVTLMGGEIGVRSIPGEGSTFHFTLPTRSVTAEIPPSAASLKGVRTLIVDDKAANRAVVAQWLRHWGMAAHTEADIAGALGAVRAAVAAAEPYQLALIDYRMDEASGCELVDAIRADVDLRATTLVMMIAARDSHTATAVADIDGVVAKPIRLTQLHDELARVTGGTPRALGAGAPEHPQAPGAATMPMARVLIAEDNPVNQLVAVRLLEQRGITVDVANTGREALEMSDLRRYDAIFMDCQMPELDGYEVTREIRAREGDGPRTPIIAMTASTLPGDTERCLAAGMDHYAAKPINPAELDAVLMRTLGYRRHPGTTQPAHR